MIMEMNGKIAENNEKLKSISEYYYKDILNQYSSTVAPLKIGDCFHFFGKYSEACISSLNEFVDLPVPTAMREIWVLTDIEYDPIPDSSKFMAVLVLTNLVTGKTIHYENVKEVMDTIAIDIKDQPLRNGNIKLLRINPNLGSPIHNQFSACIFNMIIGRFLETSKLVNVGSVLEGRYVDEQFEVLNIMIGDLVPYHIAIARSPLTFNVDSSCAILKIKNRTSGYIDYITYIELMEYINSNKLKLI